MKEAKEIIEKTSKDICKRCKKENGGCIKNETYTGLCAKNDKDAIIELLLFFGENK